MVMMTALLGVLLSQVIGISRMMLAMGRRKDLPAFLQTVHSKSRVPHLGILITGFIILLLTVFGSFEFIVRSATFTILLYYSIANLSALRQPARQQIYGKAVPVLGLAGCLLMSVALPLNVILTGVVLLVVGFGVRVVVKKL